MCACPWRVCSTWALIDLHCTCTSHPVGAWLVALACCRRAREKQARLRRDLAHLPADQREQLIAARGYKDMPRVAMAWRIAGQFLRLLKVTRAVTRDQAVQHGLGGQRQRGSTLQFGSLQHPLMAELQAARQPPGGGYSRLRWAGGGELADAQLQRLAL